MRRPRQNHLRRAPVNKRASVVAAAAVIVGLAAFCASLAGAVIDRRAAAIVVSVQNLSAQVTMLAGTTASLNAAVLALGAEIGDLRGLVQEERQDRLRDSALRRGR